jgi:FkbM family methyltransferase
MVSFAIMTKSQRPKLVADQFIKNMMLLLRQRETNNFDPLGVAPESNLDAPFNIEGHRGYLYVLMRNFPAFAEVGDMWEDDESAAWYCDLIDYRLVGHHHKRLPTNCSAHWDARLAASNLRAAPSPFTARVRASAYGATIETVLVPFRDEILEVDCNRIGCVAILLNQYCFERGGVRIAPEPGDHVIDGGAMFGETAVRLAADAGPTGRVYSFDPVDLHCDITRHNAAKNTKGAKIDVFQCGLAEHDADGATVTTPHLMPAYQLEDGIKTRSIDSLVESGKIERVDFVKMDIEGSELTALRGAARTLVKFRPKLAISLYHKPQDFFEIPLYLKELLPDYEFYLDHYSIHFGETVLYGRPRG